jgi:arylsulfatase A-like enzyme
MWYMLHLLVLRRLGFDAIHLGEATMGNVMQQAGYVTGHYGKW